MNQKRPARARANMPGTNQEKSRDKKIPKYDTLSVTRGQVIIDETDFLRGRNVRTVILCSGGSTQTLLVDTNQPIPSIGDGRDLVLLGQCRAFRARFDKAQKQNEQFKELNAAIARAGTDYREISSMKGDFLALEGKRKIITENVNNLSEVMADDDHKTRAFLITEGKTILSQVPRTLHSMVVDGRDRKNLKWFSEKAGVSSWLYDKLANSTFEVPAPEELWRLIAPANVSQWPSFTIKELANGDMFSWGRYRPTRSVVELLYKKRLRLLEFATRTFDLDEINFEHADSPAIRQIGQTRFRLPLTTFLFESLTRYSSGRLPVVLDPSPASKSYYLHKLEAKLFQICFPIAPEGKEQMSALKQAYGIDLVPVDSDPSANNFVKQILVGAKRGTFLKADVTKKVTANVVDVISQIEDVEVEEADEPPPAPNPENPSGLSHKEEDEGEEKPLPSGPVKVYDSSEKRERKKFVTDRPKIPVEYEENALQNWANYAGSQQMAALGSREISAGRKVKKEKKENYSRRSGRLYKRAAMLVASMKKSKKVPSELTFEVQEFLCRFRNERLQNVAVEIMYNTWGDSVIPNDEDDLDMVGEEVEEGPSPYAF